LEGALGARAGRAVPWAVDASEKVTALALSMA